MIESKDCRDCVKEINSTIKDELGKIVDHRSKCRKCIGCHRLKQVKDVAVACRQIGKES